MMIVLWATPRSTSTAFEWMMRQRGDLSCHHEPWNEVYYYGEDRVSRRDADVAARPGLTFDATWERLITEAQTTDVFIKDFAYSVEHTLDADRLAPISHTFLVRDPERVIQGLANHWPDCTWDEVGFEALHRLFHRIADRDGAPPPVVRSADLVEQPAATASAYCHAVGIDFLPEALEWDPGDRSDVSWYGEGTGPWHDELRSSTGIRPSTKTYPPLSDVPRLQEMYERATPLYEDMLRHALAPMLPN